MKWAINRHFEVQGPDTYFTWYSPLWTITRAIRGYFSDTAINAEQAFDYLDKTVKKSDSGWDMFGLTEEEAYAEFVTSWDKVRYPPGYGPLQTAILYAKKSILVPDRCKHRSLKGYQAFVSIAGWLQVCMGNRPIYLPCELIANELSRLGFNGGKCHKTTVSYWRRMAITDGYLKEVKPHKFSSKGASRATEFRFDVSIFEVLRKAAESGSQISFEYAGLLNGNRDDDTECTE